jgi:hypothetical protein
MRERRTQNIGQETYRSNFSLIRGLEPHALETSGIH